MLRILAIERFPIGWAGDLNTTVVAVFLTSIYDRVAAYLLPFSILFVSCIYESS